MLLHLHRGPVAGHRIDLDPSTAQAWVALVDGRPAALPDDAPGPRDLVVRAWAGRHWWLYARPDGPAASAWPDTLVALPRSYFGHRPLERERAAARAAAVVDALAARFRALGQP